MADDSDEKAIEEEVKARMRLANRERVRRWRAEQRAQRAQQATSQMPLHQMLARLKQKELEFQRMQQQYKVSCQQESLRAAHSSPKPFVTPPHAGVKHARSPTVGSGNDRDKTSKLDFEEKLEHEEKMPTPTSFETQEKMPTPTSFETPSSKRSALSPVSALQFFDALEQVPPMLLNALVDSTDSGV